MGRAVDRRQVCHRQALVLLDEPLEDGLHADRAVRHENEVLALEEAGRHFDRVADEVQADLSNENISPFTIDIVSNLVFWSHLVNKLEPWHIVYIVQK